MKVTVYIPSKSYGKYLKQAIESVLSQTLQEWEILIICDGAVDETEQIADEYKDKYPEKIKVFKNDEPKGLQACANLALKEAKGEYIMRLDADDYLDENALLIMAHYLDKNKEKALVYPNYIYIDEKGSILDVDIRKRIGDEAKLLDLPAHGACTMIRKNVLEELGGYSEEYDVQDGYDLWLKVINKYPVGNVTTPLFYYRQHGESATKNQDKILDIRGKIKRMHAQNKTGANKPTVLAVIGAKNTYSHLPGIVLREVAGKSLIDHTFDSIKDLKSIDKIVVSTDDKKVSDYCSKFKDVSVFIRDKELSGRRATTREVTLDAVNHIEKNEKFIPQIIVYLNIHAPLRKARHIQKAIDTMVLFETDEVIGVYEDLDLLYKHGENGMEPIGKKRHGQLRIERDAFYVNNQAIIVMKRDTIMREETSGIRIGHIVMKRDESFHIKTEDDIELIEFFLRKQ